MANIAVSVVIFIPPAVPDGEAPIYIRKVTNNNNGRLSAPVGMVLNPTVVMAVMDAKKDLSRALPSAACTNGSVR